MFPTNSSEMFWKKQDGGQDGGHVVKTAVAMATVLN